MQSQPNNPLHGITLETIVTELQNHYGWEYMSYNTGIRCLESNPSIKSTLKLLRKTPWARAKIEDMYLNMLKQKSE